MKIKTHYYLILLAVVAGAWVLYRTYSFGVFLPQETSEQIDETPISGEAEEPSAAEENPFVHEDIVLASPKKDGVITSPLHLSGRAHGFWFFEATAPVVLTDWDGRIIAEGYITADGEWMTEEFVPFSGTLEFDRPAYGDRGSLILKKSNPSGLSERDDAYEIPIRFAPIN